MGTALGSDSRKAWRSVKVASPLLPSKKPLSPLVERICERRGNKIFIQEPATKIISRYQTTIFSLFTEVGAKQYRVFRQIADLSWVVMVMLW